LLPYLIIKLVLLNPQSQNVPKILIIYLKHEFQHRNHSIYTCIYHNEYYLHHFILGTFWPKWECFDCKSLQGFKTKYQNPWSLIFV